MSKENNSPTTQTTPKQPTQTTQEKKPMSDLEQRVAKLEKMQHCHKGSCLGKLLFGIMMLILGYFMGAYRNEILMMYNTYTGHEVSMNKPEPVAAPVAQEPVKQEPVSQDSSVAPEENQHMDGVVTPTEEEHMGGMNPEQPVNHEMMENQAAKPAMNDSKAIDNSLNDMQESLDKAAESADKGMAPAPTTPAPQEAAPSTPAPAPAATAPATPAAPAVTTPAAQTPAQK